MTVLVLRLFIKVIMKTVGMNLSFNDCKGGYVIFNEVEDSGYHAPLSGTFEFTAYDPVHDSTVVVTNGKFRLDRVD